MLYPIDNDAELFGLSKYDSWSWITRDDSGNFWTVFRNLDGNLEIHYSTDGETWSTFKTLTNDDFTTNPMPIQDYVIVNLEGTNTIYVIGWKYNVGGSAQTNFYSYKIDTLSFGFPSSVDLDGNYVTNVIYKGVEGAYITVRWDYFYQKLYIISTSPNAENYLYKHLLSLNGAIGTYTEILHQNDANIYLMDCHFDREDGSANILCWKNWYTDYNFMSFGKISNNNFWQDSTPSIILFTNIYFTNLVMGRSISDRLIVGGAFSKSGIPYFGFTQISNYGTGWVVDKNKDLIIPSGSVPTSCKLTVNSNDDIYFFWTDGSNDECYTVKYDRQQDIWSSVYQLSTGTKGKLVMPEIRNPDDSDFIAITFQTT